jgi:plasmid maintenance system antidote protein VapI
MSAEFWLNLQAAYDLRMAERVAGAEISALPFRPEQALLPRPQGLL